MMVRKVLENFVPPLLDAVLLDYQRNVPVAREPEVLSTMEVIVDKLEVLRLHKMGTVVIDDHVVCQCVSVTWLCGFGVPKMAERIGVLFWMKTFEDVKNIVFDG